MGNTRSWRWFRARLNYLLQLDGPLADALRPEKPAEPDRPSLELPDDFY